MNRTPQHRHRGLLCVAVVTCSWLAAGCVRWQPVAAPEPSSATADAPVLPRWVRVTTRDSTRYLLEDAAFRGDTLVGRARDASSDSGVAEVSLVRVPATNIAHLEARAPSLKGSVGVALAIVAGLWAFAWSIGHAASR